jgi:hypothetical protein
MVLNRSCPAVSHYTAPNIRMLFASHDRAATYDLKLYSFAVKFNSTNLEINANGGDEGGRPCIVTETK